MNPVVSLVSAPSVERLMFSAEVLGWTCCFDRKPLVEKCQKRGSFSVEEEFL